MELPNFKKIIILIAIAICFYIIYRLIVRRQKLLSSFDVDELIEKEGFVEVMPGMTNTPSMDLPLKEYVIFSSWNSCTDENKNVTFAQLEKVAENGCRFMDFEIYDIDGKPEIGYSSSGYVSSASVQELESDTLQFNDFCNKIIGIKAPNKSDPLFLHFRVKSANPKLLEHMADGFVASGLREKLYSGVLSEDTVLEELQNRIIVLLDKTYVPNIESTACSGGCENDIRPMISMYTATDAFPSMKIQHKVMQDVRPLAKNNDDETTNVDKMQMVTHDFGTQYEAKNRDDFKELIMNHKVQIVPYKFYYNDNGLTDYKNFFADTGKRAFIRMSVAHDSLLHS